MKKMYSLVALAVMSVGVNAQIFNATFSDVTGTGGNDGLFSGSVAASGLASYTTGGSWTVANAFKGDGCLKLGTSSKLGSFTTPAIALTGKGTLTFRAGAWDGTNEKLTLKVSASGGTLSAASVTLVKGNFNSYTVNITGGNGAVKLTFEGEAASGARFFIDDIKVAEGVLAVSNVKNTKINLVKNTVVENHIIFGFSGKVTLINQNGQVVKTAKVTENEKLQVSDLTSGIYIISTNVDGKAVVQKIIKK